MRTFTPPTDEEIVGVAREKNSRGSYYFITNLNYKPEENKDDPCMWIKGRKGISCSVYKRGFHILKNTPANRAKVPNSYR